jgi:hypothetical protein
MELPANVDSENLSLRIVNVCVCVCGLAVSYEHLTTLPI